MLLQDIVLKSRWQKRPIPSRSPDPHVRAESSRTTHDAQACIEMRIKSDALSAECPSGKSALSAECPQVLKKFCALSAKCSGQFTSVLVRVLIKRGPHSHNAIPCRLHLLPALHPSLQSPLHSRPLSPPQIHLFQKTRCQTNENLCRRQQSPGGSVEASRTCSCSAGRHSHSGAEGPDSETLC